MRVGVWTGILCGGHAGVHWEVMEDAPVQFGLVRVARRISRIPMNPLDSLTDAQLSEAVAVEVRGWRKCRAPTQSKSDPGERGWCGNGASYGQTRIPPYATSADAVLPLLEKYDIVCHYVPSNGLWHLRICDISPMIFSEAPALPRAACLALLLAARAKETT